MFENVKHKLLPVLCGVTPIVALMGPAYAASPDGDAGVAITTDMLAPILDSIKANIGVILPVGIAIFGILLGIGLIPKIFRKFIS